MRLWYAKMIAAFLYGIGWAGIVMLFDFAMWENNILSPYYDFLSKFKSPLCKILGTCRVCFCFWFGMIAYYLLSGINQEYFIFLGTSELIIVMYQIVLLFLKK